LIYSFTIDLIARGSIYLLAIYFLFILSSSDKKYKLQSLIILIYCIVCSLIPNIEVSSNNYREIWINQCWIILLINGAAALAMISTTFFGKLHIKQSLILLFAVFINGFMVTILENKATHIIPYITFFYHFYDELILLTYIMMIGTSYNGFVSAVNRSLWRIQRYLRTADVCHNNFSKNRFEKEDFTQGRRS